MNELPTNEQVLMQATQGFLQRTKLKGSEVDTYAKCFNFIQTIVEGENVVVPARVFKDGMEALKKVQTLDAASEGPEKGGEAVMDEGAPDAELDAVE